MGLVVGTPITVDDDLYKYTGEQQIANLLRSGNTFAPLHLGALEDLIGRLEAKWTTAQLAAVTSDTVRRAKIPVACLVVSKIFGNQGGRNPQERQTALEKASWYLRQYNEKADALVVVLGDQLTTRTGKGLPIVVNTDFGSMFPANGSLRPAQTAAGEISGFDLRVIDGK